MEESRDPLVVLLVAALGDAYSITRELLGGGMSRVFVARDSLLSREVASKTR